MSHYYLLSIQFREDQSFSHTHTYIDVSNIIEMNKRKVHK
jgi:hypothetical protein